MINTAFSAKLLYVISVIKFTVTVLIFPYHKYLSKSLKSIYKALDKRQNNKRTM